MPRILFLAAVAFPVAALADDPPLGNWPQTIAQYDAVTIIAGAGAVDAGGNEWNNADGLPATQAELSEPHSAMADIHGNIFVADRNANAIRRIAPDGRISTILGTGEDGDGPDGPALQCALSGPQNAYVLPDGSLYVIEIGNRKVRRLGPDGITSTVLTDPGGVLRGLWVRRDAQLLYYCGPTSLRRWTPAHGSGPGSVMATGFSECGNINVAADGSVYVTDRGTSNNLGGRVYRIPADASNVAVNSSLVVAGAGGGLNSGRAHDGLSALTCGLVGVRGIAFHPLGGYFLATHRGGNVWFVDAEGNIHMIVEGHDGNASLGGEIPVPTPPGTLVMAEARSVSVTLGGDVLVACNDAGFIRRIRNVAPRRPAPLLESPVMIPGEGLRLQWQGDPGDWHYVESSPDLSVWSFADAFPGPAEGGAVQWVAPASSGAFHRVRPFRAWPN